MKYMKLRLVSGSTRKSDEPTLVIGEWLAGLTSSLLRPGGRSGRHLS